MFTIFSCANLDEDPTAVNLNPSSLTSVSALESLVTGMYRNLFNDAKWSGYFINAYGGDDISTHRESNKVGFRESDWRTQSVASERTIDAYRSSYLVINAANNAINTKENINGDKAVIDRLIGEAYFLRAFSYFHLTRTYGRVALQLVAGATQPLPRASFEDIYAQIESDLLEAEKLLPDVYPGIPTSGARPSKGAAKAYLAKLYLHWAGYPIKEASKYSLAAAKAKEVINGPYSYSLAPNIRSIFTVADRFKHREGVFTMVSCIECFNLGVSGNRTTGRLGLTPNAGGWNETYGEVAFYDDFKAAAIAEGTMKRFEDTWLNEVIPRGTKPDASNWKNFPNVADRHPMYRKIVGGNYAETVNTTSNNMNRYFMRYAEVLLIYAEASGRAGAPAADAWAALNEVHARAGATLPLTNANGSLEELAFTERKWELAGEYERMYDLIRMERLANVLANRSPLEDIDVWAGHGASTNTSADNFYFTPIPQAEIDVAPELIN
ncbi:MAG: RagB/SusD family nutrient uptake outer membrane protein [Flavobacteriia bacterium]|nr:RagB/SusD family nutrient uptake outer membrane protein [Flavobacteriia bacterium]